MIGATAHFVTAELDEGPFVKLGGDEMRRCPDQFDTARMRLAIWLSTFETRQEAMVNIDDLRAIARKSSIFTIASCLVSKVLSHIAKRMRAVSN